MDGEAPSHAGARPTSAVQRVVHGDIRTISIGVDWARALTDTELAQQTALLRTQLTSSGSADATARQGAEENLKVLEDEARRRTAAQALAGLTLGAQQPRPPGVPMDGGYALVEIPNVGADAMAQLPEGQLVTVESAELFRPPGAPLTAAGGGAGPTMLGRGAQALGAGAGGSVLASGANMSRWGFPGGMGEGYSVGIIVRPRAGVSGALNLDWGHTSLVLRRGGAPLEAIGFNPDMRTATGLIEMVRNAEGVETGTYATRGRFTSDTAMFREGRAIHIEYPINEAQAAQFAMQRPGVASQLRYTGRPAVFRSTGGCSGSNCGLWAIGDIEARTGGVVGRVGDPAGITSMGPNGAVQAGRGSQPAIVSMAEGGLENPGSIRPLVPGGATPVVSGMPRVVRVMRVGGKVMAVVGIAVGAYEIVSAPPEARGRTAAGVTGGFVGGLALGATAGLICGPGAPVCSGVLGLGLGIIGALGGRWASEELFDSFTTPATAPTSTSSARSQRQVAEGPEAWQFLFSPPPAPAEALFGQIVVGTPGIRQATPVDLAFSTVQ